MIDIAAMSNAGTAIGASEEAGGASSRASGKAVVLKATSVLLLLAAWPLAVLKSLPHQDLPAHVAAAYVADHLAQYPQYAAAQGIRTNSAITLFVSAAAPLLGYMGAGRAFLFALLAINAFGYVLLLKSLGGAKRVWYGALFAVPFVHHWFVSMGMLNFSLSFGLCLLVLSQQKPLRERWSHVRALSVVALCAVAWIAHSFPLLVLLVMAFGECVHTRLHERSSFAGALRWAATLVPAGLFVVLGSLLAPVREYARIPGVARTTWENVGELLLGMLRHFALGPSNWSGAAAVLAVVLVVVVVLNRKVPPPPGFSATTLALLILCYALVPMAVLPVWSYFGTRFVPFIWVALLVRVPETLPRRLVQFLCCAGLVSSVGSGAGFLRMDHELEDFRSGLPSVPRGASVLPMMFSVNRPGDFIEPFMHGWAHYTLERGTSADMIWASRSVDVEHYVTPPPPRFHHDAIADRARAMYSANAWCGKLVRYASTTLENCPETWAAEWHSYMDDASKRYAYVLVWDAPEATLAVISRHFQVVHRQGKLIVGKLRGPEAPDRLPQPR